MSIDSLILSLSDREQALLNIRLAPETSIEDRQIADQQLGRLAKILGPLLLKPVILDENELLDDALERLSWDIKGAFQKRDLKTAEASYLALVFLLQGDGTEQRPSSLRTLLRHSPRRLERALDHLTFYQDAEPYVFGSLTFRFLIKDSLCRLGSDLQQITENMELEDSLRKRAKDYFDILLEHQATISVARAWALGNAELLYTLRKLTVDPPRESDKNWAITLETALVNLGSSDPLLVQDGLYLFSRYARFLDTTVPGKPETNQCIQQTWTNTRKLERAFERIHGTSRFAWVLKKVPRKPPE